MDAPAQSRTRARGQIACDEVPAGLFEALAQGAPGHGFRVVEEPPEPEAPAARGYRVAAPLTRAVRLARPGPGLGPDRPDAPLVDVDAIHVWQQGPRTLGYEVHFGRAWRRIVLSFGALLLLWLASFVAMIVAARRQTFFFFFIGFPVFSMLSGRLRALRDGSCAAVEGWLRRELVRAPRVPASAPAGERAAQTDDGSPEVEGEELEDVAPRRRTTGR